MPRFVRKSTILAKIETVIGTDAVPTGAANALQVMDMSITPLDAKNVDLDYISTYFGNSVSLVGPASVKCSFSVSLAGSGTAATPPALGALLQACAMAETTGLLTPNRVEYLPATDALKTLSIYYHDDGVLHKLLASMGNAKFSLKAGESPKIMFDFVGIRAVETAVANPTAVLTVWKQPVPVTKANTVTDVTLGCTYAAGVFTGGTAYNSTGLTIDMGNQVNFTPMLTTEQITVSDRNVVGTISLDLTAAQEVTLMASVTGNALTGLGFVLGNTSGNKWMIHAPAVQLTNPKKEDIDGMRLIGYDLRMVPVSGNDELRLVQL